MRSTQLKAQTFFESSYFICAHGNKSRKIEFKKWVITPSTGDMEKSKFQEFQLSHWAKGTCSPKKLVLWCGCAWADGCTHTHHILYYIVLAAINVDWICWLGQNIISTCFSWPILYFEDHYHMDYGKFWFFGLGFIIILSLTILFYSNFKSVLIKYEENVLRFLICFVARRVFCYFFDL